jgi:stearoyl-CoA desaturase (delta-9 desaturase)
MDSRPLDTHVAIPISAAAVSTTAKPSKSRGLPLHIVAATCGPPIGALIAAVLAWRYGVGVMEIGLLAVMYTVGGIGSEVGYHRLFSHRAYQTYPAMRQLLAIAGSITGQGPPVFWVATHRLHHRHADQPGDPHSPHFAGDQPTGGLRGWWFSYVAWLYAYDFETQWAKVVPDLYREPDLLAIDRHFLFWLTMGLVVPGLAGAAITGTARGFVTGFLWGGVVRLFLYLQAMFLSNSFGHLLGNRPYVAADQSANVWWLGLPSFGSSIHNVHHAFPTSALTQLTLWELDPAGWCIAAMEVLGLAWDVQRPTAQQLRDKRRLTPRVTGA